MRNVLRFIPLFFSLTSFAQIDLNIATQARSYPSLGGGFYLESGYNFIPWERGKEALYGLIRPSIYLDSSVVINTYGSQIGIFPISILGVEVGSETTDSDYEDFTYYDCDNVDCKGTMKKNFIRYKLAIAFGSFVFTTTVGTSNNTYNYANNDKPVAEFVTATLANPEDDSMYSSRYVLGLKGILHGFLGIIVDYSHLTESTQTFNSTYLLYGRKTQMGSISFGAGKFESDEVDSSSVLYLRWSYWPLPTRRIF